MLSRSRCNAAVTLKWAERSFVESAEETVTTPFPEVGISSEAIAEISRDCGVTFGLHQHFTLERLVERRIFNVCGFSSLGADGREDVVPTRYRPEALRVAELARELVAAMERFDVKTNGRGKTNFERRIKQALGSDPRDVVGSIADLYSRYVPTAPEEKQRGRAIFIAELRDRVLAPSALKPGKALLVRFLVALDEHVLRPLDRMALAPPDVPSFPVRRRRKSKDLSVALVRGGGGAESALEKVINRDLRSYDAETAAAHERWARVYVSAERTKQPG